MSRGRATVWGAGAWGTALAIHMDSLGFDVELWVFERSQFEAMGRDLENRDFLPGFALPPRLRLFADVAGVQGEADLWISVVPAQTVRSLWREVGPLCSPRTLVVSASKGIERASLRTPCEIIGELLPQGNAPAVALSGPSFAQGLAGGDPTTVVLACPDSSLASGAQRLMSGGNLRCYATTDRKGVELGGALKNIIALACGIAEGLGFGHNTQAALITRGLVEIVRLGTSLGADPRTFSGLSGMGDLVLTCTGGESRNRSVGVRVGRGEGLDAVLGSMKMVAEGVETTRSALDLARRAGIEMPITEAVGRILFQGLPPKAALENLLARELKPELV